MVSVIPKPSGDEKVDNASVADSPTNSSREVVSVFPDLSETSSAVSNVLSPIAENSIITPERKNEFESTPVLKDTVQGTDSTSQYSRLRMSRKRDNEDQPSTSTVSTSDGIAFSRPKRTQKNVNRQGYLSWDDLESSKISSASGSSHVSVSPSRSRRLLPSNSLPSSSSSASPPPPNMDDDDLDMSSVQVENRTQFTNGISGNTRNTTLTSIENGATRARTLRSWNPAKLTSSDLPSSSSVPSNPFSSNSEFNSSSTSSTSRSIKTENESKTVSTVFDDGNGSYVINSKSLENSNFEAPIMVVECRHAEDRPQNIDEMRIKLVKKFEWKIPNICDAAKLGSMEGSWDRERGFPGNPNKKFSEEDYSNFGQQEGCWTVQALFASNDCANRITVLYEGWAMIFDQILEDVRTAAPEAYAIHLIRDSFLKEVSASGPDWARKLAEEQRTLKKGKKLLYTDHNSYFWLCQDLSYFHTIIHKEHKLAPIFYIGLDVLKSPPKFLYTAVNVLKAKSYRRLLEMKENKCFAVLLNENKDPKNLERSQNDDKGSCENEKHCVCNKRFQLLYPHAKQYLQQDTHGKLDFTNFDTNESRIVVECSDECGCSASCPRRALQRGQQTPLVVFLEGEAGWGVRAAGKIEKGSLVCEYTGQAYYKPEENDDAEPNKMKNREEDVANPTKDTSYECDFQVMNRNFILCAGKLGNVARFLNHNCDPNCVFVETYSRMMESDILIPRVSVYALRDIKVGEPVTISYWGDVSKLDFISSQIRCRCGSSATKCIQYLPSKIL